MQRRQNRSARHADWRIGFIACRRPRPWPARGTVRAVASATLITAPASRPIAYSPFDGIGDALGFLVLPKRQADPAVFGQFGDSLSVAFTVGFQFLPPPIGIRLRKRRVFRAQVPIAT